MTRALLLSDVHANLVALETVLREAPPGAPVWVTGDTVGYGPDPADVLALLRERDAALVAGNHDLAVAGRIGVGDFNRDAADAALMHRSWLSAEDRDFLASLPLVSSRDSFSLVHGSLREPVWEYVLDREAARACLERASTEHCCNGHTHLPTAFFWREGIRRLDVREPRDGETVELRGRRALVNAGSVGQPRDGDPRAAWALVDTERGTVTFRRTRYDVAETQRRMRARGMPAFLIDRLSHGI